MKRQMEVEQGEETQEPQLEEQQEEEAEEAKDFEIQLKQGKPKDLTKTLEAALFLANREVTFEELTAITGVTKQLVRSMAEKLRDEYQTRESAVEVVLAQDGASLQVKPEYLHGVSELSKKPDLSRKATKILALVAKKGQLLQSDLKKYFKGEIYLYTTELKDKGYVEWEKRGNTRLLKPSKKFLETFQLA